MSKKTGATLGGVLAALGLFLIAMSGAITSQTLFVSAIALLGFGTGIATTTNLALMLDMTTPAQVGLFIGAWGVADSAARGLGNLLAGSLRDLAGFALGSQDGGYVAVFLVEALMLCMALAMLRRIDVSSFHSEQPSLTQLIAVVGDA
jgi:BCD family chlorophyll transporter-like MFS transporter